MNGCLFGNICVTDWCKVIETILTISGTAVFTFIATNLANRVMQKRDLKVKQLFELLTKVQKIYNKYLSIETVLIVIYDEYIRKDHDLYNFQKKINDIVIEYSDSYVDIICESMLYDDKKWEELNKLLQKFKDSVSESVISSKELLYLNPSSDRNEFLKYISGCVTSASLESNASKLIEYLVKEIDL